MEYFTFDKKPLRFHFKQTTQSFFVQERASVIKKEYGNYLILKIKKSDLSTFKLLHILSNALNIDTKRIGYAGLKDKNATTIQYISLPKESARDLAQITSGRIEILERFYGDRPLKIGMLDANDFRIVLSDIDKNNFDLLQERLRFAARSGIPNYFGYQRFGNEKNAHEQGKRIAHGGKKLRGQKERLLVTAYQSHLFNNWLRHRIDISQACAAYSVKEAAKRLDFPAELIKELQKQPHFFKLFLGDIVVRGRKETFVNDMLASAQTFAKQKLTPTGLLCGSHVKRAVSDAYHIERNFDDIDLASLKGERRAAWIWPKEVTCKYDKKRGEATLAFSLPKGSYATTLLEEAAQRPL